MSLDRIITNPKIMVGKSVIRGTRLTVEYILNLLGNGSTIADILDEYDGLTQEDIMACLLFAAQFLRETTFIPLLESA
ncbi:hypothetical protein Syn7502_02599 [Synechococcus sp. PCC 7502]|uniref:DUF433 domain-containing protein n=1 Tax=Synechococcus sp. PCC 7502 TaxID=1173263 RepID=UPI00029FE7B1|nr:DUF433 domain-containing protein [Synechococcus sp. PCC 7502]AFY74561.1 hypothetical protein Syn7502_02599 [Synechococcus sp. PCC 7502]